MSNTLNYILRKFSLEVSARSPIEIPDFGRIGLAHLFGELGFMSGVEIGVEQAHYSETLCYANPNATVWGVDPWMAYKDYREHITQAKLDSFHQEALKRMAGYYNWRPLRETSMQAVKRFPPNSIDWVYIDGNHEFPYVSDDIYEWSRRVKPGGIISGHDYRLNKPDPFRNHTVQVVKAFTDAYRIAPWFVLGAKAVVSGQVRDKPRSWMWVKE